MNAQSLFTSVAKMGCMKYFPSDVDARLGIAEEVADMCHSEEQADWLCKRMIKLFTKGWPGVGEMRAVASSKFRPRDGIEAYSESYPDGIPSEKPDLPALAAPAAHQLAAGEPVSASPSIAGYLADVARLKDMNRVVKGIPAPAVRDIPVIRLTAENTITTADINRAVQELRDKKALAEVSHE